VKKKQKKFHYTRNPTEEFLYKSHQKEVKNQKRRLLQLGKHKERAKNIHNPIYHPVKLR
jgi:hypothetical protein